MQDKDLDRLPEHFGMVSRRDFLKVCAVVTASLGLPMTAAVKIAEAVASPQRPPVIWLAGQECTGCTETLLRATHPTVESLILDLISLDYHETLNSAAGHQVEEAKKKSIEANKGKFILVVEGSIPTKDGGVYCMIGGKPMLELVRETAPQAAAIIGIGSCASWGGIPSAYPNPTGAVGAQDALGDKFTVINVPGCPPNPYNFLSTVLYLLTFKKVPDLDSKNRPRFAYRRLIHEGCERRAHFDAGRFALETFNNCPSLLFGDTGARTWPVGTGCPCFGCSEHGVGFTAPIPAMASLERFTPAGMPYKTGEGQRVGGGALRLTPPATYPPITLPEGHGPSATTVGVVAGLAGIAVGAGAVTAMKIGKQEEKPDEGAGEE
jgi:hydrogenase small subunit